MRQGRPADAASARGTQLKVMMPMCNPFLPTIGR
jgi:hypothetical protein